MSQKTNTFGRANKAWGYSHGITIACGVDLVTVAVRCAQLIMAGHTLKLPKPILQSFVEVGDEPGEEMAVIFSQDTLAMLGDFLSDKTVAKELSITTMRGYAANDTFLADISVIERDQAVGNFLIEVKEFMRNGTLNTRRPTSPDGNPRRRVECIFPGALID